MRPGPSTDALAGAMRVGVRVDVVLGGRVLTTGVPVDDVLMEWASDRDVPARVTYSAPASWYPDDPGAPLACYGQRSLVSMIYRGVDGVDAEVPLGQFLHTSVEADETQVKVTAVDLTQLLVDDPMLWPSSPKAGAVLSTELQRLAGHLPVVLDDGVHDVGVPRTSQWGTSRVENVNALAASHGCAVRVGADACLHAYLVRDASELDVLYGPSMLVSVDRPKMRGRVANRWVAVGTVTTETTVTVKEEGTDGKVKTSSKKVSHESKVTSTATAAGGAYDPASYGWVTERVEVSSAENAQAVAAAANNAMREALAAAQTRSFEIVPDARLEVGDIVGVVTGDGERFAGRVTAYSLPLSDPSAAERVDVDLLEW